MGLLRDQFIDSIERKRRQLDEVLEAYENFRKLLDALPPDLAREARLALASGVEPSEESASSVKGNLTKKDLTGKTALECTTIILRERGNEPQHFSTIAKEALRRGYVGRSAGSSEEVESRTMNSFWAAMSRSADLENTGRGMYKLRERTNHEGSVPEPPKEASCLEQLKEYLLRHGPTPRNQILNDTKIPEGTLNSILKEGPGSPFAKTVSGRWYVRPEEDERSQGPRLPNLKDI